MSTVKPTLKKRIPAMIVAAMMFFTVFAVLPTTELGNVYAAGETGKVTADELYVRTGAGTSYSKLGTLAKGKKFTIKGTANDKSGVKWYKLKFKSKTGYVSSKHVDVILPTVTSISDMTGVVNITTESLTVRSGPGSIYDKAGSLTNGRTFSITGKVKDNSGKQWYRLKFKGKEGYVASSYILTRPIGLKVTSVPNTTGTIVTEGDPLNIRSGPGSIYTKLGTLDNGRRFTITGKAKDSSGVWWYELKFKGLKGYTSSKYVTTSEANTNTSKDFTETSVKLKGTVNTKDDGLTVRSGPDTTYKSLGTLKKGSTFTITAQAKNSKNVTWYKLSFNGTNGYVQESYVTTISSSSDKASTVTVKMGTTTADSGLNVRSGPGTSYSILTVLPKGTTVTITGSSKASNGKVWYQYKYSSTKKGYICSDYIKVKTITSNNEFEAYLKGQGFPESYKAGLRALYDEHPEWVFKAVKVGYDWQDALDKESVVGKNLVSSSAPVSHRSTASGSYNSKTKTWTKFDGSWYAANSKVVAYYMDPRNFLDESGIYQFMTHSYDSSSQNANTVKAIIKGSFMEGKNPGGGYSSYQSLINAAGKATGVNPNVLAAMIIQEQGWSGSSLVSGTYSGYKGYYNFFNIGAYTTSSMSAVQRGLWYAKGSGTGATSYSRPWNTPYKSIKGGAQFYAEGYVKQNQDSYYSKKFNVYNGLSKVATHQYMTFVAAAASEGSIVKKGYSGTTYPVVFEIPVFNNMPSVNCQLP